MSRSKQIDRTPKVSDLLIRQKIDAMIEYGYVSLRQFPKHEKFVLGAEMRKSMWNLLRLVIICNKRYFKKTTLQDVDVELDLLRSQVRLSKSLEYIDFKKYEHWALMNDEIGRLLGGWIKSLSEPAVAVGDMR